MFNFGQFPIPEQKLNNLIASSYHASSLMDYYDKSVFEVITINLSDDVDWSIVDESSLFVGSFLYSIVCLFLWNNE